MCDLVIRLAKGFTMTKAEKIGIALPPEMVQIVRNTVCYLRIRVLQFRRWHHSCEQTQHLYRATEVNCAY